MIAKLKRIYKIILITLKKKHVVIKSGANFSVRTCFEGYNVLGANSWLDGEIGYGSYIGEDCVIEGKIGKYCSIGHKVSVLTGAHPVKDFVSTSPCFFSTAKQNGLTYVKQQKFKEKVYADEENRYGVIIGNDVWIGYGATILGGVKIGDGAVIGANAYVNQDVEPYAIVAGQPAKTIRKRFEDEEIKWLMELRWWDKPENWIRENAELFENIHSLYK